MLQSWNPGRRKMGKKKLLISKMTAERHAIYSEKLIFTYICIQWQKYLESVWSKAFSHTAIVQHQSFEKSNQWKHWPLLQHLLALECISKGPHRVTWNWLQPEQPFSETVLSLDLKHIKGFPIKQHQTGRPFKGGMVGTTSFSRSSFVWPSFSRINVPQPK